LSRFIEKSARRAAEGVGEADVVEPEFLPDYRQRLRRSRLLVVRIIQYRSEVAILVVLGMGLVAGIVARHVLSLTSGPSAGFAAPRPALDDSGAEPRDDRPRRSAPHQSPPASPHVVAPQ